MCWLSRNGLSPCVILTVGVAAQPPPSDPSYPSFKTSKPLSSRTFLAPSLCLSTNPRYPETNFICGSATATDFSPTGMTTNDIMDVTRFTSAISKPIPKPPSLEFLTQAQSWIHECGHKHNPCPLITGEPQHQVPTRVLKITKIQEQDRKDSTCGYKIQLQESNSSKYRYAALSHCWGTYQPARTTKANYAQNLEEIPWDALPRTFQDAAVITHGLGIQYLWIDSLCIIQDDQEDWNRESGEMKHVYGFSYVTLAAAAGSDGRHGLFPRSHDYTSNNSTSKSPSVEQQTETPACALNATTNSANTTGPSPLFTRAWILQESLLASRTLYFHNSEVVFECANHILCQCSGISTIYPQAPDRFASWKRLGVKVAEKSPAYLSLRYRFKDAYTTKIGMRLARLGGLHGPVTCEKDLWPILNYKDNCTNLELWDEVVSHYCRRKITKLSDRLSAICGIAGAFGSTGAHGHYFGGLWEVWLCQMLCWYLDPDNLRCEPEIPSETDPPMAPSWSWAKVRGSWCFRRPPISTLITATVVRGEMTLAAPDGNKFGALSRGIIVMKGILTPVVIRYAPVCSDLSYADKLRSQKVELLNKRIMIMEAGEVSYSRIRMRQDFVLSAVADAVNPENTVYCLPLQVDEHSWPPAVHGIVLRSEKVRNDFFSRIGMFTAPIEWFPELFPPIGMFIVALLSGSPKMI